MDRSFRPALPDAIEAAEALLGAILVNNDAYWRVAGFLKPQHFTETIHARLYETMGAMISEGRAVNPITVKPYVPWDEAIKRWDAEEGRTAEITVGMYIVRMQSGAVTVVNAYDYGRAVIETWARRQIIARLEDAIELARHMPVDMTPEKIIAEAADNLTRIAQEGNERAGSTKYGVLLPKAIESVTKASTDHSSRIPWFLPEITRAVGNIRRTNLIGLMSDSGGGKTSFSLAQLRYAASQGFRCAFFSIEISEEEAALQAAAQQSRISLGRIDDFTLNTNEQETLGNEMMDAVQLPFYIVGFGECSLSDIRIKIEAMVKSHGLDLVIIDHAKMITLPGKAGELFAERINMLYRGLKAIAKTLNVAIVILIQRNDDWKQRFRSSGSIRPIMGDAYGGGSIKQSLDVWFSLYRPEPLYRELLPSMPPERLSQKQIEDGVKTRKQKMIEQMEAARGKAWVINHKRRRGEPGNWEEIRFEAEFTLFASPETTSEPAFEGFDF